MGLAGATALNNWAASAIHTCAAAGGVRPGFRWVNGDIEPKLGTAWWTRLPDGGMRRVWVSHADGQFHCCRELSSAEQEVARVRLETYAREGGDPSSFLEDVRLAAQ